MKNKNTQVYHPYISTNMKQELQSYRFVFKRLFVGICFLTLLFSTQEVYGQCTNVSATVPTQMCVGQTFDLVFNDGGEDVTFIQYIVQTPSVGGSEATGELAPALLIAGTPIPTISADPGAVLTATGLTLNNASVPASFDLIVQYNVNSASANCTVPPMNPVSILSLIHI